jgi:hypothetical protein
MLTKACHLGLSLQLTKVEHICLRQYTLHLLVRQACGSKGMLQLGLNSRMQVNAGEVADFDDLEEDLCAELLPKAGIV